MELKVGRRKLGVFNGASSVFCSTLFALVVRFSGEPPLEDRFDDDLNLSLLIFLVISLTSGTRLIGLYLYFFLCNGSLCIVKSGSLSVRFSKFKLCTLLKTRLCAVGVDSAGLSSSLSVSSCFLSSGLVSDALWFSSSSIELPSLFEMPNCSMISFESFSFMAQWLLFCQRGPRFVNGLTVMYSRIRHSEIWFISISCY